jgi:hypothetical protein
MAALTPEQWQEIARSLKQVLILCSPSLHR